MGLFNYLFGRKETAKYNSDIEFEQKQIKFNLKYEKVAELFKLSLEIYNSEFCQCAYPRFQQLINIDCCDTGNSFKCYDTEILIETSKKFFEIESSELTDECANEIWTFRKCGSTYDYGWSDFSIHVDRQKLKLNNLTTQQIGKPVVKPVPLYFGLMGHSMPSKSIMKSVGFNHFKNYMTEK